MPEITTRRLGRTDFEITPIGFGAMEFSGGKGMIKYLLSAVPPEQQDEVIKVALDRGMNWIDTAEIYGSGESERAVSQGLQAAGVSPGEVMITTKWMPVMKRAKSIHKAAAKSTGRLDPYPIDLYLVHRPESLSSVDTQMDEMANLVDSGTIRAVGVSNFSANKMRKAYEALEERGIPLAANQMHFSLVKRNIEFNGVLETAKELGVTIIAYTPLGQGSLTGHLHKNPELLEEMPRFRRSRLRGQLKKTKPLVDALEAIALEHEVTIAQIVLNWTVNYHGDTIVSIPGATKTYQAEDNANAMRLSLSKEQMETISTLSHECL
ncbi:MAG: aldo/keto reductase [Candidatus Thorarchaeota archaeon]|jgi:aryl-alcohol dehydrogenase-like predicted oxidoreductase